MERIIDTFVRVLPERPAEAIFVLGPEFGEAVREQLTQICSDREIEAGFVVQEKALGTAHAVYCAGEHLEGEGIVAFADTLFDMDTKVQVSGADVIAWVKYVEDPSRFGVAVREGERIVALVEKPDKLISNEALIGVYFLKDLGVLRQVIKSLIDEDRKGPTGEYYLTDAFDQMLRSDHIFKTTSVTEWLDCGTINALMDTTKLFLTKETESPIQGEVKNSIIHNPVYIGPNAKVHNSVIGPYVSIEEGAEVQGSILKESIIFAKAQVEHAVLANSMVGQFAEVRDTPRCINVGDHAFLG